MEYLIKLQKEVVIILVGRFHPFIGHEDPYGELRYNSTLFLTSTLEEGEGSASRPGRLYITLRLRQDFIVQSNFCIVLYHTDQFHIQLDLVRIMDQ